MKQKHWLSLTLIILLLGCTPTDYEEATATNELEAVVRQITSTPISPTPTAPVEATRTLQPSTVVPTATPTLTRPEIAETVVAMQPPREYDSYLSPDGRKRVEIIIHDCVDIRAEVPVSEDFIPTYGIETLNVVDVDDNSKIVIDDEVGYCGGLGAHGFEGLFWSENSRFFYYTQAREGVPDGCGQGWSPSLYRYDTEQESIVTMGGGERSPDGTKLAVWEWQIDEKNHELVVWDVESGEEIGRFPDSSIGIYSHGGLAWSPDGLKLVFGMIEQPCIQGDGYLVEADLSDWTQTTLFYVGIDDLAFSFSEIVWNEPKQIVFPSYRQNDRVYNIETGELTEILPEYYGVFDRVMGRPVTTIEEVDVFPYSYNLLAYQFESVEMAATMANAIQPNGTVIHYLAPDGTNARETIVPRVSQKPYWWHIDDTIFLYMGSSYLERIVELINEELKAISLNAEIERKTIYVRVANDGDVPIETVMLDLGGGEAVYTDMFVGKKTSYQSVGEAADFGTMLVGIAGKEQEVVIEGSGEMLDAGNYTLVISIRSNGAIVPELRPDGFSY